ncbi:cytochrome b561 and DOMON domain-containing protein At3g07570, partial [Elaeis guineensis]|uniref:cytochrome b561 and DOMON domain-containing protein At3g07570 n=1 Tax=Elaeis guineensis var. tenera TaxID=51953 RepID=UPI003C6D5034
IGFSTCSVAPINIPTQPRNPASIPAPKTSGVTEVVEMKKASSLHTLFLFFLTSFAFLVKSQSDSCSSKLSVSHLIPFNTSSLRCFSAWSSQDFILRYENAGSNVWSYVLSAPDTGSYISIGFSGDGSMVGSSAMAGWITSSGPGIVKRYYLGGTSSKRCPPDQGSLDPVQGKSVITSQGSRLYLAFQLNSAQPPQRLIYAVGPQNNLPSSDGYLPRHKTMASGSINLSGAGGGESGENEDGGGATGDVVEGGVSGFDLKKQHAILVMLGWGVLMPIGMMMARYFKQFDPFWFYSHISIQGIGFLLGVAGIILGFKLGDDEGEGDIDTHKNLGIFILVFGCLQVMAFLARPGKDAKVRRYWNWYHYWVGRAAIACAVGNIFYGLDLAGEDRSWSIGYGIFLGVWGFICLVLEVRGWMDR